MSSTLIDDKHSIHIMLQRSHKKPKKLRSIGYLYLGNEWSSDKYQQKQ